MTCWSPSLNLEQESRQRRCFCVNTLSKSCPSPPLPSAGSNLPSAASNSQSIALKESQLWPPVFSPNFVVPAKILSKNCFWQKRGRVRSCTTVCNAFSASSARARVQKCTKMQAGRSFAVAETSQQLIAVVHWQSMEEQLRCFFNPPPLTLSSRQCLGQRNQENLRGLKT